MSRLPTAALAFALALAASTAPAQDSDTASTGIGTEEFGPRAMLASELLGQRLFATRSELPTDGDTISIANTDWSDIGEINDLILAEDGIPLAALVGVGGFLGIGEKEVAIGMSNITMIHGEDGQRFLVIDATEDELRAAPAFEGLRSAAEEASGEAASD
ncbi:hypothetical protein OG2516_08102 [Oceanicola granulosus HTCC2516]|uniref:PRC-barrel domain-containing protein n=1 Tax=Oceanicola granulosus (strain ATCC BAA-861 / DSM 15982 / KCTC 12143 / HTCC2516) TaxID=314256 RepID=Q2CI34_OCEGH|nr:PRC-barrel domain-containing protein [Oceanicola granulosus]EAR52424.1 hypothetical protein OG2516_08102 [Oceanicola granulosus HTCC2516]